MRKVVIVGGGTAGWMTASFLRAAFGGRLEVSLVESGTVGTIGVGEATFSDIRHFFRYLDLKEREWMPACNATYKLAVRFEGWRRPGDHFYHPFEMPRRADGIPLTEWWLNRPRTQRFDRDCFVSAALCDHGRSPRFLDGTLFTRDVADLGADAIGRTTMTDHQGEQFPYAYHFDAALLAARLSEHAIERGVKHLVDDVVDVRVDERGWIEHVVTREHGALGADLFVDCTGFRGLLINQALGVPFVSYQDTLPNDRAVALQVPLDMERVGIRPCTTATAQDAGWIWTIPLWSRVGTGYVYSSDYLEPEAAERTLREFVGAAAADVPANHLRMRVGRCQDSWVRNCVAIGLSSGFVEPLESTGIFFIHHAVEQLVRFFPNDGRDPRLRDLYNKAVNSVMDGVREFLVLHYVAAARNDTPYWRDAKTRKVPDTLAERIEMWQTKLPDGETVYPYYHGFPPYSYNCILLGMGGVPLRALPALQLMDDDAAAHRFQEVSDTARTLVEALPTHYEFFHAGSFEAYRNEEVSK